ncbi:SRPBCC family protein [Arenimonas alkanexedens]
MGALALALSLASGVSAEVKDSRPEGFTLENTVRVAASAELAWAALVDDVDIWWPRDHTWWGQASTLVIEPRVGGCFCETAGKRQAEHMAVTFVDPERLLRMTGGLGPLQGMGLNGALEFRLTPADGGATQITLWYRVGGYTPDDLSKFAPVVDGVQARQLAALAEHLARRARPIEEEF